MPAVPQARHDIFVSYAHDDNLPVARTEVGFVSQLVADLRTEITRKVHKELDIWWDHYSLSGGLRVTPEIMQAASGCASIVIVGSPAYLRSEWCGRERDAFLQVLGRRESTTTSVFLVTIERLEYKALPRDLQDFRMYEFFHVLEDGRSTRPLRAELASDREDYVNRLALLAQHITDHLLAKIAASSPRPAAAASAAPPAADAPCVLLLDVTDDVRSRHAELRSYLEQSGVTVLPDTRYSRDDMDLHRTQLTRDLARSRACVQVLGGLTGDRSDHPRGMAWLRYECVQDWLRESASKLPFIQWRDPDLPVETVADADAKELLSPSSVRTDRFPDFRRAIAELALKAPESERRQPPANTLSVFVNSDLLDRGLAESVAQWLESQGFMVLEPPRATADAQKEWETNLRYCDSLMLVYGQTKPSWVKTQLLLSNKVARDAPLDPICVCVGPPAPDPEHDKIQDLALRYSSIHYLRNEHSPQPDPLELQKFVSKLRERHVQA
jgi:hypothetical protein